MQLSNISSVYFLGIGGIGMSALARYFMSKGVKVSGYDRTATELTRQLEAEGMSIHYMDDISLADPDPGLVVFTPAIPSDHGELNYYRAQGFPMMKRSQVLGLITGETFSVCVAGTHGKTTTSSLIAHILRHSGFGCNAFLGGIAANYNSNFWSSDRAVSVAEADEYDRSFLQLRPDIAVITSMDPDHLDIYGTAENLLDAFVEFGNRLKPGGFLLTKYGLPRKQDFIASNHMTYSVDDDRADVYAESVSVMDGRYVFSLEMPGKKIREIELFMGGRHNIENAIAAITVTSRMGLGDDKIKAALADFQGVKRRFEYIMRNADTVMIDDYAHHPEELRALISSAKELYPGRKCTVIFQPHLFSRTQDHADGFAEVLSMADECWLLPIYPAREKPMPGVNSGMIAERMKGIPVKMISMDQVVSACAEHKPELLITAGAGDIDTKVQPIRTALSK
ncbi:MAG TPA: UDP-N-acetylmuramate--L-alanine ligase [Chitinophagaceae bacterium]|nr:UDP-N-acetylmuramate--L-alanine ligase [Chitinophagaceae bacterium]HRF25696.1 UDP-N-acetylmuramate--L-alanine ligase [Ferruginibacter sp.]